MLVFVKVLLGRRMYLTKGEEEERVKQGNGKEQQFVDKGKS